MRILSIESSCDETAAAVVEDGTRVLTHSVASSASLQKKYGGVVPEVAARRQVEVIIPVINEVLEPLGESPSSQIDALAVTIGPGLIGSLLVGVETAKALGYVWEKPLVPVNHLVGHIYSAWLAGEAPRLPALALIVSGGHTELILVEGHGVFHKIGQTLDDAAGEAFDKVAQTLGLSYPGGPEVEKLAQEGDPQKIKLPRPMIDSPDFNFSFSGLKTAVLFAMKQAHTGGNFSQFKADLAASFQQAVIDVLVRKTFRAVQEYPVRSVLLTGGVAANKALRKSLERESSRFKGLRFFCPPVNLATDNATYIATAAYFNFDRWVIKARDPRFFSLSADPRLGIPSYTKHG